MYEEMVRRLREAAKMSEALAVLLPHSEGNATAKLYNEAAEAIEALSKRVDESIPKDDAEIIIAEVAKPRWIPVTERLPEAKRKVLVATFQGGVYYGFLESRGQFYTANSTLADSWCWEPNASHWMPLPEPPKE